jgi:formylglycine-generating enzyme required for sulfatase activity
MLETALSIWEIASKTHDAYKCLSSLVFGNKQEQYLQEIAADMTDLKVHIERLSDTMLYAVNLEGVRAARQENQHYINDLREIRQLLEPIQQALQQPLLASAMVAAPPAGEEFKPARHALTYISPLEYVTIPLIDNWDGVPVLFKEQDRYFVGWQSPGLLSKQLGCEYHAQWQSNRNELPPQQRGEGRIIIEKGEIQERSLEEAKKKEKIRKPSSKPEPEKGEIQKPSSKGSANLEVFQDTLQNGSKGPEMICIPAGKFRMGDIQGTGETNEKPVHEISVKRFAIGRYQITFAEYDKFAKLTKRKKPNDEGWGRDNRPVIYVSWEDAVAYTEWLSEQTGQSYRLPTEAEWEYAARAGTETDYWWGNDIGKNRANCSNSGSQWSGKQTAPVGSFEPNPFGLYDTVGNVWEWTCSEYENKYSGKEQICLSKEDSNDSSPFVLRGGSWDGSAGGTRSAGRNRWSRTDRNRGRGFRLARIF